MENSKQDNLPRTIGSTRHRGRLLSPLLPRNTDRSPTYPYRPQRRRVENPDRATDLLHPCPACWKRRVSPGFITLRRLSPGNMGFQLPQSRVPVRSVLRVHDVSSVCLSLRVGSVRLRSSDNTENCVLMPWQSLCCAVVPSSICIAATHAPTDYQHT